VAILSAVVSIFAFRFRSRASLELRLIALQHQLAVLRRQRPGRPKLSSLDRLLWVLLYRIWPQVIERDGKWWSPTPGTCARQTAATTAMSLLGPMTSSGNSARRTGNNSPPRSNCQPALRPGPAPSTAHSFFARFANPSAARGGRHYRSVTTDSVGTQMIPPVWGVWVGAFSCLSLGHSAWLAPGLSGEAMLIWVREGEGQSRWYAFSEQQTDALLSPKLAIPPRSSIRKANAPLPADAARNRNLALAGKKGP
jgi:hypothetical protein